MCHWHPHDRFPMINTPHRVVYSDANFYKMCECRPCQVAFTATLLNLDEHLWKSPSSQPDVVDDDVTYELLDTGTQRGGVMLSDSIGFTYTKKRETKAERRGKRRRCSVRSAAHLQGWCYPNRTRVHEVSIRSRPPCATWHHRAHSHNQSYPPEGQGECLHIGGKHHCDHAGHCGPRGASSHPPCTS